MTNFSKNINTTIVTEIKSEQEPQPLHARTAQQAQQAQKLTSPVEGYPYERDMVNGHKCIRVGDSSILNNPLTSIVISRGASSYGIKNAQSAAEYLAVMPIKMIQPDGTPEEICPNLVTGGTRSEDLIYINKFIEAGGRVAAFIPVGFAKYDWPPKVVEYVKNGQMVIISYLKTSAEWLDLNAQHRNSIIAEVCHSLFVAECVAGRQNDGTISFKYSGTWDLAEKFYEQEKQIFFPHWVFEGGRPEHLVMQHQLEAIMLDPVPMSLDAEDAIRNPYRVMMPRSIKVEAPEAESEAQSA